MSKTATFTATINTRAYQVEADLNEAGKGKINGESYMLDSIKSAPGKYHVIKDNQSYTVELLKLEEDGKLVTLLVNGNKYQVQLKDQFDLLLKNLGMDNLASQKINEVKAPMPGLVLQIIAEPGQAVSKGDALIVLEAMKMENVLKSPGDGIVKKIAVTKGQAVEKNQLLIQFE